MKKLTGTSKRCFSVSLAIALVVTSLVMGFGRVTAGAVAAAGQTASIQVSAATQPQNCSGTGSDADFEFVITFDDSTTYSSGNIVPDEDMEESQTNTWQKDGVSVKPITSIVWRMMNYNSNDDWFYDWVRISYYNGSAWVEIGYNNGDGIMSSAGSTIDLNYNDSIDPFGAYNKTLTWDANGGTIGGSSTYTVTAIQGATYPSNATNVPNTVSRAGYTFTGWSPAIPTSGPSENTTYKAQWSINYYTITFDANGGAGGWSQSLAFGSTLTPPTVYRTGYSFTGWSPVPPGTVAASNAAYTAQWSADTYYVIFDANGGSGSMSNQGILYGSSAVLTTNAFTRTGYSFTGWNTAANGSGTSYANAATFGPMGAANVTLYAQWSINSYTITFDANGGTGGWSQSLQYGSTLLPPTVSKTGYSFAGWSQVPPATVPAANATYTAQWTVNTYYIIYNASGGSGSMSSQGIQYGASAALTPNAFTRTGYTFAGWNTAANGSGTSYGNGATFGPMPAYNVTLYAQWSVNTYYVIFNANGGLGSMSNQGIQYGASAALTANAFTRTGYTFTGWNTTANGSGTPYADGTAYGPMPAANVTLYAQWTINSYTITFDAVGGTGGWSQLLVYGSTLTPPTVTRTGYTFNGWSPSPPGTVPASNATYTAQWSMNTYFVIFNANGGSGLMPSQGIQYGSSAALTVNAFTRTNYTFAGWNTAADGTGTAYANQASYGPMGASNVTLYAQWSANTYFIMFDANDGSGFMSNQGIAYGSFANLTVNTFTKTGHTFAGWNTAADGSGSAYANQASYGPMGPANVTLYAQWSINSYTITFDANGGEDGWSQLLVYGSTLTAPTVTRTGYSFNGWSPVPPASVPASDATYTAQWTVNTYFVVFDANGGSGSMDDQGIIVGASAALTSNVFSREGYTFTGWNTAANGSGTPLADNAEYGPMGEANITLYAQWNINTYHIIFDANSGAGSMPDQAVEYHASAPLTANTFTRAYYTFAGWNMAADGSGTFFADGATYGPMGSADVTLYAIWQRVPVMLAEKPGSTTVFAAEAGVHYIYGLEEGLGEQAFRDHFVQVDGDGRLQITQVEGSFGTGTRVDLYDNVTNTLLKTYRIVIFGDVDGDGYVTAADENLIDAAASYQSEFVYGTAAFYAADIMQDGGVDALDLNIVSAATSYTGVLDQVHPGTII